MSLTPEDRALIAQRVADEQAWAYERRIVDGHAWRSIRGMALRPASAGGIGRDVTIAQLKDMVAAHRAAQGDVVGTRDERIERRQLEYDIIALAARSSIARASEVGALDVHAAKVLLDVRGAEAKMHGDDAAQRIEADVTHHDGATAELFAMLDEAGIPHEHPEEMKR
tara:strand:+ start:394 stop:897 length:504 start_codon:yes stop_codon:yes gene_type:complete